MKKNIRDYLPKKEEETTLVQARVPKKLADQVHSILKEEKITWGELLRACLERFLDEMNKK